MKPREYEASSRARGRAEEWRQLRKYARAEEEQERERCRANLRKREASLSRLEQEEESSQLRRASCAACVTLNRENGEWGRQCASCWAKNAFKESHLLHFQRELEPVPSWDSSVDDRAFREIRRTAGSSNAHLSTIELKLLDLETEAVLGRTEEIRLRALREAQRVRARVVSKKHKCKNLAIQ